MIYFVQGEDGGLIKIGTTTDIESRMRQFATASPVRLMLLACIDGGVELEGEIHEQFVHLRSHGEWFEPAPELLAFIAKEAVEWFAEQAIIRDSLSRCTNFRIRAHATKIAAIVRQKTGQPFSAQKLSFMLNSVRVNPKDVELLAAGLGVASAELLKP